MRSEALFLAGLVAVAVTGAEADNVDAIIKGFKTALDKMDIPDDRKAGYKEGLEKSRECLAPIVNGAPPERVSEYAGKLGPIISDCSKSLSGIPHDHVTERQVAFANCMKEKVESGFDSKQVETLAKIKECFISALN